MAVPLKQQLDVGLYVLKQRLKGVQRYPLVLMLEPLFRCNLACAGCGKIDYPAPLLNRRLSVDECLDAARDCGLGGLPGVPRASRPDRRRRSGRRQLFRSGLRVRNDP